MIRTFNVRKMLFTPVGFLNSVASWLLNVRSPSGTIRIKNTANPTGENGPSFDIDAKETASAIDGILSENYPKRGDKKLLSDSLLWENGKIGISREWLRNAINSDINNNTKENENPASTDNTGASTATDAEEDFDATFTDWSTADKKVLKLRLYAIVTGDRGEHTFNPIDIEFTKSGMLKSAKSVEGKSIFIGA